MFIRNSMIGLSAAVMLSACASTQSPTDNHAVNTVPEVVFPAAVHEQANTRLLSDNTMATPANNDIQPLMVTQLATNAEPYQCMLAMAKNMQDAMTSWINPAKSCNAPSTAQH